MLVKGVTVLASYFVVFLNAVRFHPVILLLLKHSHEIPIASESTLNNMDDHVNWDTMIWHNDNKTKNQQNHVRVLWHKLWTDYEKTSSYYIILLGVKGVIKWLTFRTHFGVDIYCL